MNSVFQLLVGFMGLAYIAFGGFVIKNHWFMVHLTSFVSWAMGSLLIAYGAFRMYRAYKNYKENL